MVFQVAPPTMVFWIDAQLSPAIATWMRQHFAVQATSVRDLGLRNAADAEIFQRARQTAAIVVTKDADFLLLSRRFGTPPQVLWLTCGNTSNDRLRSILGQTLPGAIVLLSQGEAIVQISGDS